MSEHDSLVSDGELLGRERHSFECLGRKALAHAAPRIAWCPTMDLLAVADATQAVHIHRLSWQKIHTFQPLSKTAVTSLAWQPDGRVLAVSYKDGTVILYNVGAGRIVHQIQLGSSSSSNTSDEVVSDMHWAKIAVPKDTYIDPLATLSELQPLSLGHNHATLDDTPPAEPTMLVLGTTAGHISFYAFGVAPCGRVDTGQRGPVQQLALAPNMSAVAALVGESPQFVVLSLDCGSLSSFLRQMSLWYRVAALSEYFTAAKRAMSKAWQASLKELDAQFSEVARQTRVDDKPMLHLHLLHMLATGVSKSPEVEAFLTQKLVVRRLKQLDTSVQESYTRLNDVLRTHFFAAIHHCTTALTAWVGLERLELHASSAPLLPGLVLALDSTSTLSLKATELLQVVHEAENSFRHFANMLYHWHATLEISPIDSLKAVQGFDPVLVAKFIREFLTEDGRGQMDINRVEAYLHPGGLKHAVAKHEFAQECVAVVEGSAGVDNAVLQLLSATQKEMEVGVIVQQLASQGFGAPDVEDSLCILIDEGSVERTATGVKAVKRRPLLQPSASLGDVLEQLQAGLTELSLRVQQRMIAKHIVHVPLSRLASVPAMCLSAVSAAAVHHVPRPEAGDNEWLFEAVLSEEVGEVVTMRAASAADGTGCVLWGAAVKLSPEVAQICQLSPYHERGTLAVMERHNDEDEVVLALLRHRRPASELRVVHVNGGQTAVEAIRAASTDISRGGDYIIKWRAMDADVKGVLAVSSARSLCAVLDTGGTSAVLFDLAAEEEEDEDEDEEEEEEDGAAEEKNDGDAAENDAA